MTMRHSLPLCDICGPEFESQILSGDNKGSTIHNGSGPPISSNFCVLSKPRTSSALHRSATSSCKVIHVKSYGKSYVECDGQRSGQFLSRSFAENYGQCNGQCYPSRSLLESLKVFDTQLSQHPVIDKPQQGHGIVRAVLSAM